MEATLQAVKRETRGKNEARRLRAAGRIPGVVYGAQKAGDEVAAIAVAVDPRPLMRILHSESGANTLIALNVEGEGTARVLVKEFLLDPVTHDMLHADFYRVNMDRKIAVTVPIVLKGEPKGVKLQGGVLDFVHREIEMEVLPAEIPDFIEIDVSEMNLGDAVHLRDVMANAAWTPLSDADMMLVHVITPKVVEEEVPAEAAAVVAAPASTAEPEVIKKGKTEKEGEEKKDKK
ncbi:MAG: 50S ribosomal protein L25 [Vicinamibacterales bacterium]